jgi:hypothetical protein
MNEQQAKKLAATVGGEVWQSGGGIHLVVIRRPDGSLVVFSEDLVAEYPDDDAFDASMPSASILLRDDPTEYWVVQDADGGIWMDDREHVRGWSFVEDAQHEAAGIQSRLGVHCWARQQTLEDSLQQGSNV